MTVSMWLSHNDEADNNGRDDPKDWSMHETAVHKGGGWVGAVSRGRVVLSGKCVGFIA